MELADDAKELLTKIGIETSLRYAMHLISAATMLAHKRKAAKIDVQDVGKAYTLFLDVKRSVQYLQEYQEQYMYNEIGGEEGDAAMET